MTATGALVALTAGARGSVTASRHLAAAASAACTANNGGLTLPAGFCASVFADSIGGARHVVVAPNGDVFVATRAPRAAAAASGGATSVAPPTGLTVLRDTNSDGKADVIRRIADANGTGVALGNGYLYVTARDAIVRYPLRAGALEPNGAPDTILTGLPTTGHSANNFVLDGTTLYVNYGSLTNSCQQNNRSPESPGIDPCVELETRAGIWRFDANRKGQTQRDGERFATGIRNAVALAKHPTDGGLYSVFHGRDGLLQQWPKLYNAEQSAENPGEEFIRIARGDDYGWPYCYYDVQQRKLVLAPEYGGDGGKAVGRCASKKAPLMSFPGHWAPNGLLFYTGSHFPSTYRGGAFVAFHGSWNRAPLPQAGFKVVFAPFKDGKPDGTYTTFADGFRDTTAAQTAHRPVGLAQGPDGALYITDDVGGRIWKVVHTGAARR